MNIAEIDILLSISNKYQSINHFEHNLYAQRLSDRLLKIKEENSK